MMRLMKSMERPIRITIGSCDFMEQQQHVTLTAMTVATLAANTRTHQSDPPRSVVIQGRGLPGVDQEVAEKEVYGVLK